MMLCGYGSSFWITRTALNYSAGPTFARVAPYGSREHEGKLSGKVWRMLSMIARHSWLEREHRDTLTLSLIHI